jgi:hypothetical protein
MRQEEFAFAEPSLAFANRRIIISEWSVGNGCKGGAHGGESVVWDGG